MFLFLIALAASLPFLLCLSFGLKLYPMWGAGVTIALGVVYFFMVWRMAFKNWRSGEKAAKERWKEIQSWTDD